MNLYFLFLTRWLGVWIEAVSSLFVFFSAVFSLVTPGIDGAILGLSVSYALQVSTCFFVRAANFLDDVNTFDKV